MNFKDSIKKKLKARNLSQKEFAKLVGTTPSQLSDILNNRRPLRLEFITACKKIFPELQLDELTDMVFEDTLPYARTNEVIIREIRILLDELDKNLSQK